MKRHSNWARLRVEAGHGGCVPQGWRLAWWEPRRRVGVYYPPPLHWIARAMREIRYRLLLVFAAPPIEGAQFFETQRTHRERRQLAEEYSRGYLAGWRECFQACLEAVREEMSGDDGWWEIDGLPLDGDKTPPRSN